MLVKLFALHLCMTLYPSILFKSSGSSQSSCINLALFHGFVIWDFNPIHIFTAFDVFDAAETLLQEVSIGAPVVEKV